MNNLPTTGELFATNQVSPNIFRKGLKQWGWLAGAAIKAWRDYEELTRSTDDDVITARVLVAYDNESSS
jgi:hypothetical protein